ncbi:hypothetical protein C3L57_08815, partial [Veillonellaceae bacterium M2-8]|nr:hypothetical protein [Veillonellaceae bacterium M2-8]
MGEFVVRVVGVAGVFAGGGACDPFEMVDGLFDVVDEFGGVCPSAERVGEDAEEGFGLLPVVFLVVDVDVVATFTAI